MSICVVCIIPHCIGIVYASIERTVVYSSKRYTDNTVYESCHQNTHSVDFQPDIPYLRSLGRCSSFMADVFLYFVLFRGLCFLFDTYLTVLQLSVNSFSIVQRLN